MDVAAIHQRLSERFGQSIGALITENPDPYMEVEASVIEEVCALLKSDPEIACDYMMSLSGVDDGEKLWLVYHLFSYTHRQMVVLKLQRPYDELDVPSCCSVWKAANWHEREQYDLFGFNFVGHPDLRRLLLPEDWVGHPLLKSYEYPKSYHGIEHDRPDPKEQLKAMDERNAAQNAAAASKETPAS